MKSAFVDWSQFDHDKIVVDKEAIGKINPHRHELALLDGILLMSHDLAVGFKDIQEDAFWVRGHFPDKPIMPGVWFANVQHSFRATSPWITKW